jgi:hypothetical protein
MGVTALSSQATITGMTLQPGNVSVLSSPTTLEMTQLQGLSAYLGTTSLPEGTNTGVTIKDSTDHGQPTGSDENHSIK